MSEVERFHMAEWSEDAGFGAMDDFVYARDYDEALSQLAALREELSRYRSGHANLVDRNALLRQRPDLPVDRIPAHEKLIDLQQRLADADRRNAELRDALNGLVNADSVTMNSAMDKAEAALTKPEEAKS